MQLILVASLAVLGASLVSVSEACDCRTAASCPQAYVGGTATGCYLNRGRSVGVCCPPQSSSAQGFASLFNNKGTFGTSGQSNKRLGQSPAGFSSTRQGGNQPNGAPFRNRPATRNPTTASLGSAGLSGQPFSAKSGKLTLGQGGFSSGSNIGRPGRNNNFGSSGSGTFGQSSSYANPAPSVGTSTTGVTGGGSGRSSYDYPPYGAPTPPVGECRPLVLCPPVVTGHHWLLNNGCSLPDGSPGTICSFAGPQLGSMTVGVRSSASSAMEGLRPMVSSQSFAEPVLSLRASPGALQQAQAAGRQASRAITSIGSQLANNGLAPAIDSPTALFFLNSQSSNLEQQIGLEAVQVLATITNLVVPSGVQPGNLGGASSSSFGAPTPGQSGQSFPGAQNFGQGGLPNQGFRPGQGGPISQGGQGSQTTTTIPTCTPDPPISCANSLYRSITGECNNLHEPKLGSALTGFKRLLPNTFNDGIFEIRTRATRGGQLPSARYISERVLDVLSNELRHHTLSLMQIGQFVDHDFTHALVFRLPDGAGIECCLNEGQTFPNTPLHPQCIPIPIPFNDPFYKQFEQRCMSLVRSLPALPSDCVARPARPLNELTSFIDSSNVYGSTEEESRNLRAFQNGLLRESPGRLLPLDVRPNKPCRRNTCYHAGDTRVNEQSLLTVIHTIWMREHNRIARELQARHPRWGDERLYQEARRVLGAEWQHILYNEWLPVLIGFEYSDNHGLLPLQSGHSRFYDPRIDPTISNSFATAAFRFGHTMVRDMYDTLNANGFVTGTFNLSSTFFDPSVVGNGVTEHARTMIAMRSEAFDTSFARSLHEQLFTTNHLFGLDLLALNIQRGRDHGTPTYAQVVEACRLVPKAVNSWADFRRLIRPTAINKLADAYDDPRDVDLFIGGVAETVARGAQVGPTFQCLIGQQFFDLRYGDRFFYDNGGMAHSFSLPQLDQIRRANWARIMCDNLGPEFHGDFTKVQPLAILTPIGLNNRISCDSLAIPRVDLGVF